MSFPTLDELPVADQVMHHLMTVAVYDLVVSEHVELSERDLKKLDRGAQVAYASARSLLENMTHEARFFLGMRIDDELFNG